MHVATVLAAICITANDHMYRHFIDFVLTSRSMHIVASTHYYYLYTLTQIPACDCDNQTFV